ncbi:MAG TPA: hypothetical protein ENJ44_03510 [Oceanospirillales bacterium]|nr:hypothetical protein [Oceanospirillales bacterium]
MEMPFILLVVALIWVLPIILITMSTRTHGGEKVAWILAIMFISWLAWIFYILLAPIKPDNAGYK